MIVECVKLKFARHVLADSNAAHAIALRIDRRRVNTDSDLTGNRGNDASGHAALRRHTHLIGPFTSIVVHAARVHDRQNVAHMLRVENLVIGGRVRAVIGKRCGHDCEVVSGHTQSALPEVELEDFLRVVLDHRGVQHHISDGAVSVARREFRLIDRVVDFNLAACEARKQLEHIVGALSQRPALHHLRDCNRTGIHHRVEGAVSNFIQHDRVEGFAGWLHTDLSEDARPPVVLKRIPIHEGFGDGLYGEWHTGVTDGIELPIHGGDGDTEKVWVNLSKLRDIVRRHSAFDSRDAGMDLVEIVLDGRKSPAIRCWCGADKVEFVQERVSPNAMRDPAFLQASIRNRAMSTAPLF